MRYVGSSLWKVVVSLIGSFLILCLAMIGLAPISAQSPDPDAAPLSVATVGLLDTDGSGLYSVMAATGNQSNLSHLIITSRIPDNSSFVEAVWTPQGATFVGQKDGIVSWTLDTLAADTLLGPFTYRVTFKDNSKHPLNVAATIKSDTISANATLLTKLSGSEIDSLQPLASLGNITVDAKGTDGFQSVGDSGIWLSVPQDAVTTTTKLTFVRLPIDEANLPKDLYWWCSLVRIQATPPISFTKPVSVSFPTRRTLTPYTSALLFGQNSAGQWIDVTKTGLISDGTTDNAGAAYIDGSGNYVVLRYTTLFSSFSDHPVIVASGVDTHTRTLAVLPKINATGGININGDAYLKFISLPIGHRP